jgi:hypothetical protein
MKTKERRKGAQARAAMADQVARETAFNDNRERLRSARMAREAELKAKGNEHRAALQKMIDSIANSSRKMVEPLAVFIAFHRHLAADRD